MRATTIFQSAAHCTQVTAEPAKVDAAVLTPRTVERAFIQA